MAREEFCVLCEPHYIFEIHVICQCFPRRVVVVQLLSHVWLFCDPMAPARLLSPWDFPGKNTEVGCHFLLQGIFPTQ